MPELWERDQLAGRIHSIFRLTTGDGRTMYMKLVSVSGLLETEKQRSFSIVFQGPPDMPLSQGMYRMEHDGLETIDLFIVPVGRSEKGLEYEAVFNRLK